MDIVELMGRTAGESEYQRVSRSEAFREASDHLDEYKKLKDLHDADHHRAQVENGQGIAGVHDAVHGEQAVNRQKIPALPNETPEQKNIRRYLTMKNILHDTTDLSKLDLDHAAQWAISSQVVEGASPKFAAFVRAIEEYRLLDKQTENKLAEFRKNENEDSGRWEDWLKARKTLKMYRLDRIAREYLDSVPGNIRSVKENRRKLLVQSVIKRVNSRGKEINKPRTYDEASERLKTNIKKSAVISTAYLKRDCLKDKNVLNEFQNRYLENADQDQVRRQHPEYSLFNWEEKNFVNRDKDSSRVYDAMKSYLEDNGDKTKMYEILDLRMKEMMEFSLTEDFFSRDWVAKHPEAIMKFYACVKRAEDLFDVKHSSMPDITRDYMEKLVVDGGDLYNKLNARRAGLTKAWKEYSKTFYQMFGFNAEESIRAITEDVTAMERKEDYKKPEGMEEQAVPTLGQISEILPQANAIAYHTGLNYKDEKYNDEANIKALIKERLRAEGVSSEREINHRAQSQLDDYNKLKKRCNSLKREIERVNTDRNRRFQFYNIYDMVKYREKCRKLADKEKSLDEMREKMVTGHVSELNTALRLKNSNKTRSKYLPADKRCFITVENMEIALMSRSVNAIESYASSRDNAKYDHMKYLSDRAAGICKAHMMFDEGEQSGLEALKIGHDDMQVRHMDEHPEEVIRNLHIIKAHINEIGLGNDVRENMRLYRKHAERYLGECGININDFKIDLTSQNPLLKDHSAEKSVLEWAKWRKEIDDFFNRVNKPEPQGMLERDLGDQEGQEGQEDHELYAEHILEALEKELGIEPENNNKLIWQKEAWERKELEPDKTRKNILRFKIPESRSEKLRKMMETRRNAILEAYVEFLRKTGKVRDKRLGAFAKDVESLKGDGNATKRLAKLDKDYADDVYVGAFLNRMSNTERDLEDKDRSKSEKIHALLLELTGRRKREPEQGAENITITDREFGRNFCCLWETAGFKEVKDLPLFGHTPAITDVKQGHVGDCVLLSVIQAITDKDPDLITDMMEDLGDKVRVRFYEGDKPYYVTVEKSTVINLEEGKEEDAFTYGSLWVRILEKAYAAAIDRLAVKRIRRYNDGQKDIDIELINKSKKLKGRKGYTAIDGVDFRIIMEDFMGKKPEYFELYSDFRNSKTKFEDYVKKPVFKADKDMEGKEKIYSLIKKLIEIRRRRDMLPYDQMNDFQMQRYIMNVSNSIIRVLYQNVDMDARERAWKKTEENGTVLAAEGEVRKSEEVNMPNEPDEAEEAEKSEQAKEDEKIFKSESPRIKGTLDKLKSDLEGDENKEDKLYDMIIAVCTALIGSLDAGEEIYRPYRPDIGKNEYFAYKEYEMMQLKAIEDGLREHKIITCGSLDVRDFPDKHVRGTMGEKANRGLIGKHAYTVCDTGSCVIGGKEHFFILLKNPHAHNSVEYNFDVSKGLRRKQAGDEDDSKDAGYFYMELHEFCNAYKLYAMCK